MVFVLASAVLPQLFSQNLKLANSVISSSGNYSKSSSYKLSWTAGEPVTVILESNAHILTVGFQQNWDKIVGVNDIENPLEVLVFPNPSSDKVAVRINTSFSHEIFIELLDLTGSRIYFKKVNDISSGELILVNISSLSKGIYLLHVYSPENKISGVYKVIKQ